MNNKYNYDHDCPFEAYITNLGKYNEGDLIGEWVKFPVDKEDLDAVFKRIGVGEEFTDEFGQPYEEWFITDYDVYVDGLYDKLGEYEDLDKLNELGEALELLHFHELETFQAVLQGGLENCQNIDDLLMIIENLDDYYLLADVDNDYDLGYYWIEEYECYDLSSTGKLQDYFDYERFGRDVAIEDCGAFTDYGYVYRA